MIHSVYVEDEPIFWSLVDDMRAAGYDIPWYRVFKPSGFVSVMPAMSDGIHWMAGWTFGERAGMAVRNPNDFVKIVNPA